MDGETEVRERGKVGKGQERGREGGRQRKREGEEGVPPTDLGIVEEPQIVLPLSPTAIPSALLCSIPQNDSPASIFVNL